jgi:hypothetical protein
MKPDERAAMVLGRVAHAALIGLALALALLQLVVASQGGTTFRYAGF